MSIITAMIAFLYASSGVIAFVGYLPTIRDLQRHTASANSLSYVIWVFCGGVAFLYLKPA